MEKIKLSRRSLLHMTAKGSAALMITSVLGSTLQGCKKRSENNFPVNAKEEHQDDNFCEGVEKLTDDEKAARKALKYVDNTNFPGRACDNCKIFTLPQNNSVCGGCKIVPGPIHPKGYCAAWIARM